MIGLLFLLLITVSYLIGSLCSAIIVSWFFALPDPRTSGSTNPGATNVLRLAGKKYAAIVLISDMLKGVLPVLIVKLCGFDLFMAGLAGFVAVLGHMYPIFFKFKGGKGVATTIGVCLGLHLMLGILVIITWLMVIHFTRYSSLASLVAVSMAPWYSLFTHGGMHIILPLFFTALFVIYQHRNNITRLMDHQEPKIKLTKDLLEEELKVVEKEAKKEQDEKHN